MPQCVNAQCNLPLPSGMTVCGGCKGTVFEFSTLGGSPFKVQFSVGGMSTQATVHYPSHIMVWTAANRLLALAAFAIGKQVPLGASETDTPPGGLGAAVAAILGGAQQRTPRHASHLLPILIHLGEVQGQSPPPPGAGGYWFIR